MAWRREGIPMKLSRERPYVYELSSGSKITLLQNMDGIGTSVWDGSIVLARYLEHLVSQGKLDLDGKSLVELGAGCGLVGLSTAAIGCSRVVLTESGPLNCLKNLEATVKKNSAVAEGKVSVEEHTWGKGVEALGGPFDVVIGAEIMYVEEATADLIGSIRALAHDESLILLSYGRNRQAEDKFMELAGKHYDIRPVPAAELHPEYHHDVIKVIQLKPRDVAGNKRKRTEDDA